MQYQQQPISTLNPTVPPNQLQQQQQQQQVQQQQHQVAFGSLPSAQPGSLSYGFGLSPASNFNSWNATPSSSSSSNSGWKTPIAGNSNSSGFGSFGNNNNVTTNAINGNYNKNIIVTPLMVTPNGGSGSNRRRRRSMSPDEDDREYTPEHNSNRGNRIIKRVKVLEDVKPNKDLVKDGIDLGKALASLPKSSLLTILTSLLTTQPTLTPLIQSLLPPPTLSQTLINLAALERSVLSALPSAIEGGIARDDYIYGRIRIPLEEYITECKTYLNSFCSQNIISGTVSGGGGGEDEIGHPSTTFSLLHSLSSSLRRIELALPSPTTSTPNPLSIHLLPLLINSHHLFLTKLSTSVNQEGKIISGNILRNWFERMDQLCIASPGVGTENSNSRREGTAKKALEGVRDRMRKEVGWLIGLREIYRSEGEGEGMMDEEEL